ncbi:hypothetical protein [Caulobacter sp. 3R27C2-B]|uniref:hypothetical protein n=1 Tax=Caulobacter sp. 3R27C2-B TaxID=2502219 RepID=UPI0010F73724|nr:hypothetical protein [Caulobacter sp. 3R27C2-B]
MSGAAKSLGEKLADALDVAAGNTAGGYWASITPLARTHYERVALAFCASLSHEPLTQSLIDLLEARITEQRALAETYPLGDPKCARHGGARDGLKEALEITLIALHGSPAHG